MKRTTTTLILASLLSAVVSVPAMANHMSVSGAGTASMPNDIHNTQIEDDLTQDEWTDFVQSGDGADTVNRYE